MRSKKEVSHTPSPQKSTVKVRRRGAFSRFELILFLLSCFLIISSFLIFDRANYLTLTASLVGVTSLILTAKGNPMGQLLMIVFSVLYGIISLTFSYYGEMMTYLGMTAPMAVVSLISWLKNPYDGHRSEVRVGHLARREIPLMLAAAAVVTLGFYFILDALDTANMLPSTISVTTSFLAAYLTFRRSEFFSLAYSANDVILIILWSLASIEDPTYISVTVCFCAFLFNDIYAYISWSKMKHRQAVHA